MRPRLPLAALVVAGLFVTAAHAAPPVNPTVTSAPTPPPTTPPTSAPASAPQATADSNRMMATTFLNLVVYENGAGYLHAFWQSFSGPVTPTAARLQWGRGCPEISDRVFMALHTAFANPERFTLIVDKSPDARQPGAYCVTGVELKANRESRPATSAAQPAATSAAPPAAAPPSSTSPTGAKPK